MPTKKAKHTRPARAAATKKKQAGATEKTGATKKATAAKKPGASKPQSRADFGKPVDGFFAKQPPHLRPIVDELRKLVEQAAPAAQSSLKWGNAFYTLNGKMLCGISAHKAHVNLILAGPADAFADPEGRLSGEGTTGRHLRLTSLDELPRAAVRGWLRAAAGRARKGGK
jgi:hypothetical protein